MKTAGGKKTHISHDIFTHHCLFYECACAHQHPTESRSTLIMAAASTDTKLQAFFSAVKSRTTSEETDALLVSLKVSCVDCN